MYIKIEIDDETYYVERDKFDIFLFSEYMIPEEFVAKNNVG